MSKCACAEINMRHCPVHSQEAREAVAEARGVIQGLRMAAEIVNARNASAIAGAILREAEKLEREMKESEK